MKVREGPDGELARMVRERIARVLADQAPLSTGRAGRASRSDDGWASGDGVGELDDEFDELEADRAVDRADRLPKARSRLRSFGPAHLAVIAVVGIVGLLVAGWAVIRAQPISLATPIGQESPIGQETQPSRTSGATAGPASASPTPSPAMITVHVLGAVRKPGLITLPERSRVADAIERAGGLAKDADPGRLNLAQLLADGQQIVIGTAEEPAGEVRNGDGGSTGSSGPDPPVGNTGAQVDLNSATQAQLEQLPGVGPVTAGKIIAWREQHGRFSRVEELQEIDGIGPKTFAQLAPYVRV